MAVRTIVQKGDPVLEKVCKPVEVFDKRLWMMLDDMQHTLRKANGAGLAAPQIGVMRRVAIIVFDDQVIELINPKIVEMRGKQRDVEGCLSCPGVWGYVTRAMRCKVKAQDRYGNFFELNVKELGARAAQHEIDHLNGRLFVDMVDEFVDIEEEKTGNKSKKS